MVVWFGSHKPLCCRPLKLAWTAWLTSLTRKVENVFVRITRWTLPSTLVLLSNETFSPTRLFEPFPTPIDGTTTIDTIDSCAFYIIVNLCHSKCPLCNPLTVLRPLFTPIDYVSANGVKSTLFTGLSSLPHTCKPLPSCPQRILCGSILTSRALDLSEVRAATWTYTLLRTFIFSLNIFCRPMNHLLRSINYVNIIYLV